MTSPTPLTAEAWWGLFQIFLVVGFIAGATVMSALIYYALRYRGKEGEPVPHYEMPPLSQRAKEAVVFASISAVILFGLAVVSLRVADQIQYPPPRNESLVIQVTAFQWDFRFTYPNGYSTLGVCRVPAGRNVIFNVTSTDVFHDFGIPDFRTKIDAIPGRYNLCWIVAPDPGPSGSVSYQIKCYELCGAGHPLMMSNLLDMAPDQYDQWYRGTASMPMGGP